MEIFSKEYDDEELNDLSRDISEALSPTFNPIVNIIPVDGDTGFVEGKFTVTITWKKDE